MPGKVWDGYKHAEQILQKVLKTDRKAANKLLSAYLNLLTVYPDQPYDQPETVHPIDGDVIVKPANAACFEDILPKEEKTLELVRAKVAAGERVLIYTSWTRTDSQQKLLKLLTQEGYRTEILSPTIPPAKREKWVEKRVRSGVQVLISPSTALLRKGGNFEHHNQPGGAVERRPEGRGHRVGGRASGTAEGGAFGG